MDLNIFAALITVTKLFWRETVFPAGSGENEGFLSKSHGGGARILKTRGTNYAQFFGHNT